MKTAAAIGIGVVIGAVAVMVAVIAIGTSESQIELQLRTTPETIQADEINEVIEAFEQKYSQYEIKEYLDSQGVPWKYTVTTNSGESELILGDQRIVLRYFQEPDKSLICTIINPQPIDITDYCPPKY